MTCLDKTRLRTLCGAAFAALALTVAGAASAGGDIFRCSSGDGHVEFTNVPGNRSCVLVQRGPKAPDSPVTTLVVDRSARRIAASRRALYDPHVLEAARAHSVEPELIHAVISAESGYNPLARSVKGATGLMQLIPETGARYGATNLLDPRQNIDAGTRYLKDLMALFRNDVSLALAAYNAGENAVLRYGAIPPFAETRSYVPRVMAYYKRYRDAAAATNARAQRATNAG